MFSRNYIALRLAVYIEVLDKNQVTQMHIEERKTQKET